MASVPKAWVTVMLMDDGSVAFKGSCLDSMQQTTVLLAQGMRDYHISRVWERVKEKMQIRPASPTETRKLS